MGKRMKRMEETVTSSQKTRGVAALCRFMDLFSFDYLIQGFSDSPDFLFIQKKNKEIRTVQFTIKEKKIENGDS